MPKHDSSPLIASLILPELSRQLSKDTSLWPNVKGLFTNLKPVLTPEESDAREAILEKVHTVKIQIEDHHLLNFITGGMSGVKAYMSGRIKVKGDLILAQRLEDLFEKANGKERVLEFLKQNEELTLITGKSKL
ncbi:hypothetical protein BDF14DRAFT_1730213 [Spinellus fusiger]|nr:hypothetical protein BDF14DRAFT_1730213 [Spinellus fusiger]